MKNAALLLIAVLEKGFLFVILELVHRCFRQTEEAIIEVKSKLIRDPTLVQYC